MDVRERDIDLLPPKCAPPGDRACPQGMCPAWESNLVSFVVHSMMFQPTEHTSQGILLRYF